MGTETDISNSDEAKSADLEEIDSNENSSRSLDQDEISKLLQGAQNETTDETLDETNPSIDSNSDAAESTAREELDSNESSSKSLDQDEISKLLQEAQKDPIDEVPEKTDRPVEEDSDDGGIGDEINLNEEKEEEKQATLDDGTSDIENPVETFAEITPVAENDDNDFIGLDDDELGDDKDKETKHIAEEVNQKSSAEENKEISESKGDGKKKKIIEKPPKSLKVKNVRKLRLSISKIISLAFLALIVVGVIIYIGTTFIREKKELKPVSQTSNKRVEHVETVAPVQAVQKPVNTPEPPSKHDVYVAKLEDVARLRDELLTKKEEIHQLKNHYEKGIAQLIEEINGEMHKAGINSLAKALKNKRIELKLRTIQRRRAYIRELQKPARWIHLGSEELLYLKRKAQVDLQVAEIAGGIDMEKHMRHINAAIQKYRPSADKLAIDPSETDLPSLKTIWSQIKNQPKKMERISLNSTDEEIEKEICTGNFKRIAQLSRMSERAAKCVSKMNGMDLFLNGIEKISPGEAQYLFQWRGNWICLNGVKELSPEVAQYLFKWAGDWISLNGLTEFPAELAKHLLKWNGKQIELMGLDYNEKKSDREALKYLVLWETMGGKLFVSGVVRKEMERVMM